VEAEYAKAENEILKKGIRTLLKAPADAEEQNNFSFLNNKLRVSMVNSITTLTMLHPKSGTERLRDPTREPE